VADIAFGMGQCLYELLVTADENPMGASFLSIQPAQYPFL
jgi:hypothetical protein